MDAITIIGTLTVFAIAAAATITFVLSLIILISLKTKRTLFPNLITALISSFESPVKMILAFFKIEGKEVMALEIELKNKINESAYARTPYSQRMILLPQCLRHSSKCPAKLTAEDGIVCVKCGLCKNKDIHERAKKLGYMKTVIAPGGTFAGRMIKKHKPKAVLAAGCVFEIQEGLRQCIHNRIPAQGVLLAKDGCIDTIIDIDKLYEAMELKM
ncbi:DUF116 domain-containing protein [Candidatus Micrarchaeota archaeon]|nr:DUF116 domain-containing protein [Candidatus Micrarchaeota archaeon]